MESRRVVEEMKVGGGKEGTPPKEATSAEGKEEEEL
jgi:hypothetical protein